MIPNEISVSGLNAIRAEEGRALRAYQDAVGVWTVGYGLTNYDKGLPWKVGRGLVITEAEAEWHLLHSLKTNYEPDVRQAIDLSKVSHPQGALDGGMGFHFNTGGVKRASWPKYLNKGQLAEAKASLASWNKAGGRVLSDLTRRRAHEWGIISAENYGHLTGPTVVVPNASGHETYKGHAELLTELPSPPGHDPSPNKTHPATIEPSVAPTPGSLTKGDTGPAVEDLQRKLNEAGHETPVNGQFDDATETSVKDFQATHPNMTVDGHVGPGTDSALVRNAAVKGALGTVAKSAGPVVPGVWIATHQWFSAHAANIGAIVLGAAVLGVVGYIAWHYRHDLTAIVNRKLGRRVP